MKVTNKMTGNSGEENAMSYLQKLGYIILEKNFKTKTGEIDLIAKKDCIVIFIEVKSRKNNDYGFPREAVHRNKQHKIIRTAQCYIKMKKLKDTQFRFDVIEMYMTKPPQVNHIKNAFWQ